MVASGNIFESKSMIKESLRIANTVPQNIPHTLTRDTVVNGYALKRGTIVVPQLSAVLYDPEVDSINT